MKRKPIALVIFTTMLFPMTSNAFTSNFSASGATGEAFFFQPDACHTFNFSDIGVFENSSKTGSAKVGNAGAFVSMFGFNNCTNNFFNVIGNVDNGISFKKTGKTITASGVIPAFDFSISSTIDISFNLTFLQRSDTVVKRISTIHEERPSGTSTIITNNHDETTSSDATVTGNIFGNFGGTPLEGINATAIMGNTKSRSVNITK